MDFFDIGSFPYKRYAKSRICYVYYSKKVKRQTMGFTDPDNEWFKMESCPKGTENIEHA